MADGRYDIVVFGATGFTGDVTAEYLAEHAPEGTRWALAGRNRRKLEALRSRLARTHPAVAELPLLAADVNDRASIRDVADATRVVITTVGPYILYGEPLVAACAAAGTGYVDLTGEPEFVDSMWIRHHQAAEQSGARIVHSCGFDSNLRPRRPLHRAAAARRRPDPHRRLRARRRQVLGRDLPLGDPHHEPPAAGDARGARAQGARIATHGPDGEGDRRQAPPRRDSGGWVVPFPTIDPQTVLRSARALERYGPSFSYSHYLVSKPPEMLVAMAAGVGAAVALAQLPPTRRALLKLKDPGEGPLPEQREHGWFRVRFAARAGEKRLVTEVSGGDPGYSETSKMLAEAALCLANDQLPGRAGQLTPAVAMGQPLIDRLAAAGIKFQVLEEV